LVCHFKRNVDCTEKARMDHSALGGTLGPLENSIQKEFAVAFCAQNG
jgi:hypothetical protein